MYKEVSAIWFIANKSWHHQKHVQMTEAVETL
jgi:hypothetical protein